jgi:hypothetical protein
VIGQFVGQPGGVDFAGAGVMQDVEADRCAFEFGDHPDSSLPLTPSAFSW